MRTLILALAFAGVTFAQSSAASSGSTSPAPEGTIAPTALSPCARGCIAAAAANSSCETSGNVACMCTDPDFQFKATSCLAAECQAPEMGTALGLQASQCRAMSLTPTASASATVPFVPSNSAADISSPASGSSSASASGKTGGAVPLMGGIGKDAVVGMIGAVVVMGVGALVVL
ncbi:hypothetical protein DFH09DRAFT_1068496 [Mycena vulgaris]|nr:hypothetical protein DFH09DRAFT_1068496 [Mycena vulgaris]